jgi:uncharacterized membrane protein YozB (DUF420 family)
MLTTVAYVLATLAIILIVAGLFFASDRRRHVPLMLGAFAADMVGLVIVEVVLPVVHERQDPVSGIISGARAGPMRLIHAALATAALVGYLLQIWSGRRLMKADRSKLGFHRQTARWFVLTRFAAYVTMYFV